MVKFNVEQAQNVEQSKKIPCCKSLEEQLEIMELYTDTHRKYSSEVVTWMESFPPPRFRNP